MTCRRRATLSGHAVRRTAGPGGDGIVWGGRISHAVGVRVKWVVVNDYFVSLPLQPIILIENININSYETYGKRHQH